MKFCRIIICGLSLFVCSCAMTAPYLVKQDDVFLFRGSDSIVVSFTDNNETDLVLKTTASMIQFILNERPKNVEYQNIFIEGLSGNGFVDFFIIADNLILLESVFKNKMLIYSYIAFLYEEFRQKNKEYQFVPLADFKKLFNNKVLSVSENDLLTAALVQYSIDSIYFISLLEFLERQDRYFYPMKAREELFQVLIFPEIVSFWKYMEFRFGKTKLFDVALKNYTPEEFHVEFGEKVSDLESAYVKYIKDKSSKPNLLKQTEQWNNFTNTLYLYMSGTKRSLMSE
ncbi:MAG: hypothetical protein ACRCTQ_04945 [Brevinemataceae bacterium]